MKPMEKNLDWNYSRLLHAVLKNPGSNTSQNSSYMATYLPSHKSFEWNEEEMTSTAEEMRTNLYATFFYRPLHIDLPVLADRQRFTCISSMRTLDAVLKTYQEKWMIGTDDENESRNSVLSVQLDLKLYYLILRSR